MTFVVVLAAGVFSCDQDKLNPVPKTVFSDKVVFDTPEKVLLQVNGLYASMKSGQVFGGRVQIYGDIRANDFLNRTNNGVTGLLVWNHSITENSQNDVINFWTNAYATINQVNVFLDGIEANATKFESLPFPAGYATTATQYTGEARYIRALLYHTMLQYYAKPWAAGNGSKPGLPLRLKGEKDSNNNELARASVDEVYTQIIADLDFAEANLPANYGTDALLNTTRAHKNSAIALKTRVYLTKGDYAKVITEAQKIVPAAAPFTATSGVPHALQANINNVFTGAQQTTETVLSMPFTAQNTPGGQNSLGSYYRAPTGTNPGVGEFGVNTGAGSIAADLVAWPATDARRVAWLYTQSTETFLGKYPGGTPYLDRAPVQRWSEVLLNYAEALARTKAGVDAQALALLNAVRTRSAGAGGAWAPADNATLIDNIMTERRIEFLGEGLRNQDIMRLQQAFPSKGAVAQLAPTQENWVWPIPVTERLSNRGIVQNSPND